MLVVLHTLLVERHLTSALEADLPTGAPSTFLIDVQPDQWPQLSALLAERGAGAIDSVPVVMARLAAVGGRPVDELAAAAEPGSDREWALTREQRLTYLEELPPDNELAAGELWSDPGAQEVSVEEEFAAELGVGVGDTLTFDVQGVEVPLTVTSLRRVDWRTFRINFFVVVEPGVLEEAPQNRIAAADLPPERRDEIEGRIVERFPNVTLIDVREILDRVTGILRRLALGVRFLGTFTALAGLAILVGAVAAGAARRGRELALLKTLGFTRGGLAAMLASEHLLTGLVAGVLGATGAVALTWFVVTRRMELDWHLFPGTVLAALLVAVLLAGAAGLAASTRALRLPPVEVLREER